MQETGRAMLEIAQNHAINAKKYARNISLTHFNIWGIVLT